MSSERARLTALYGGLLTLAGALLMGLVYVLVSEGLYSSVLTAVVPAVPAARLDAASGPALATSDWAQTTVVQPGQYAVAQKVSTAAGDAALSQLLTVSALSLAVYAALSVGLAWWMAGRVLRPVGVITARARRLSGSNLHERIALKAPPGELKELADTFDGMLDRIEQLVAARQRFAANAAHELRTPLAVQRAAAEIGLADDPPPEKVAWIREKLIDTAAGSEQLIEGLLLLAVSDEGLRRREPVDLGATTTTVTEALAAEAAERDVTVDVAARPVGVEGDPVLLDHLVHNLVANAVRHNHPGGTVRVRVGPGGLEVANTGPVVAPETVPLLFEPFRRARARRHAPGEGAGLGLSIVASVARAHGGEATATANPGGGLTARVTLPTCA
ncbi:MULTISPECIES: HAMP domain-containing sensor histidine kinase [Streptomyces]|uniref:sensor histidine kinase n=1 Tax=Streptomyces TaxID=1883 RepID=UPI00103ABC1F|nr:MULTISPECIES: ATP-binding protein [Streptomyces]MBT3076380.1 HAMP domain-containing protein [Streptomyces sp. COG21]MBT3079107.1 HAMP domain-containing protein [Streptomyces sp. COG20]MBT3095252.1 HAMP domain-containing protein [Streptomyces sp. CBG30]MBT3107025.1 HAMP domain-containing protein [Streptomyces sp. COG19]MBT3109070.1 HAMP domain-containing protein [Streptomyces sp. CYG20]